MAKLTVPTCTPWANMQKRPRWPRHQTYGSGVKGQKRSNFKQRQTAKLTMPTCRPWASMQKCPRWPRRQTYGSGVKGQKRSNSNGCVPVISDDSCLVLSFFLSSNNDCFFFHMLDWMFTKLGQKHVWVYGYKTYGSKNSLGVIWGHKGQKR